MSSELKAGTKVKFKTVGRGVEVNHTGTIAKTQDGVTRGRIAVHKAGTDDLYKPYIKHVELAA